MRTFFPASRRQRPADSAEQFAAAIERLYREEFARVYRYLDRSLGDAQLATDLAQEAFIRLSERQVLPDEPVAWLISVATNLLRDDRRRTSRRLRLLSRSPESVPQAAPAPDPSTEIDRAELRAQVRAALDQLNARDREVLLLRHSGYSYHEIATALDIAEAGVGTVLLRATARFRSVYEELHGHDD